MDMKPAKKAKLDVLEALKSLAMDMIQQESERSDEPQKMQKIVVAAKDKEGLKKGLDKAEEILDSMPAMKKEYSEEECLDEELYNKELDSEDKLNKNEAEEDDESPEEIEAKIAELKKKLEAKKNRY